MKENSQQKRQRKTTALRSAKECAYVAVFVALTIASQLAFSAIPSVEIVTVLFVTFAFTFRATRGVVAATAFSLLRQFVFGVDPKVLVLYLLYFNLLALIFGLLGETVKVPNKKLYLIVLIACICTVCFTMIDNILTPLWYGYSQKAARLYFKYSLPVLIPQVVCTAVTTSVLFLPLRKAFLLCLKR